MASSTINMLWQPSESERQATNMAHFSAHISDKLRLAELTEYRQLHQYSVDHQVDFWRIFVGWSGIKGSGFDKNGLRLAEPIFQSRYFEDVRINLAENLLSRNDDDDAIIFYAENKHQSRLSWRQLHQAVSKLQQALQEAGLQVGDRVAAVLPNCPEAVIAMLATQSLGGVWSSCSPDFGVQGILERFTQIEPKFLFCSNGYWYNGKEFSLTEKNQAITEAIPNLKCSIISDLIDCPRDLTDNPNYVSWTDFVAEFPVKPCYFTRLKFNHPAFILFSSGTTGKPKCFIHGLGSYLLSNRLDLMLHNDVRRNDRTMFFTTCGWMMWNWLIGSLGIGSAILLYDGSPFADGAKTLFHLAEQERLTLLGVSPKFLSVVEKEQYSPKQHYNLENLRRISTSGSPLSKGNFNFVYQHIKNDLHLCPISGGTDILGCFLSGDPRAAVCNGEMQVPVLNKNVIVMDDNGAELKIGLGELVCRPPFLGMPLGFWDDDDLQKYHNAYFDRFDNIWCHGDYLERTETGYIIHGRSDTVLNPGGVRIGTAEIYQAIEQIPEIADAVAVGQQWDDDVRIILFVEMAENAALNDQIRQAIRQNIKHHCSPRHLPALILDTEAIPRTRSGKISEKAVTDIIHGREVRNQEALSNPEALQCFSQRTELA